MSPRRAIPRVAVAALTLGGASGCGGDDVPLEERARAFCDELDQCGLIDDADTCAADYYFAPAYVTEACKGEMNALFRCLLNRFECGDEVYVPYECGDEAYDAYVECDFGNY
ncbi:MAG: hypothetical protein ACODAU_12540 [Myxococcota bacterium]